jgi:hypothetical protein
MIQEPKTAAERKRFSATHEWTAETRRQVKIANDNGAYPIHCGPCGYTHYDQIWPCIRATCPLWQEKRHAG